MGLLFQYDELELLPRHYWLDGVGGLVLDIRLYVFLLRLQFSEDYCICTHFCWFNTLRILVLYSGHYFDITGPAGRLGSCIVGIWLVAYRFFLGFWLYSFAGWY